MPEQAEQAEQIQTTPNVKLTLTCGNSKCKQLISEQVVAITAAANLRQMMSTQRLACPFCMKVGRCHVTEAHTDAPLTGGDRTVETTEGTLTVTPRSHKPDGANRRRRDGGNANRNKYTPQERGTRRRQARAAGKTAIPPMSARQRRKLERRSQAEGVLVAKSRSEVERARTNQPQVPTLQPAPGQSRPASSRAPTPSAQPRTRSAAAREAGKAAAAASLAAAAVETGAAAPALTPPPAPLVLETPMAPVQPAVPQPPAQPVAPQSAPEKKAEKKAAKKAAREAKKAAAAAETAGAPLEPLVDLPSQLGPPQPEPAPVYDVDILPTSPDTPAS